MLSHVNRNLGASMAWKNVCGKNVRVSFLILDGEKKELLDRDIAGKVSKPLSYSFGITTSSLVCFSTFHRLLLSIGRSAHCVDLDFNYSPSERTASVRPKVLFNLKVRWMRVQNFHSLQTN